MTPSASTQTVERRFGDLLAVDGVTFEVHPGEIVGLLGANGAGKTTLIRMLLGLLVPTRGRVALFGGSPDRAARRRMGYMPQGSGLYDDLTVGENLAFAAGVFGVRPPAPGDLESVMDVVVGRLPLGIRKRVGFVTALAHTPDLLVLDEPTSGVGPLSRAELWDDIHLAAEEGAAVVVTTHYMDEAEQCDRLVVLASGREVAAGTVTEIVGETSTVEVETPDPREAMDLLESQGIPVLPAGHRLRLPGADAHRVGEILSGRPLRLERRPASLEEAFVVLAARRRES
ncbi:MAG: ABC transporter ATP-binding protein [Actinomycetota bacterium]